MERPPGASRAPTTHATRRARQQEIRDLVAQGGVDSQHRLAELLAGRGYAVTQATVSRDIAELGLVKVFRNNRHEYAAPGDLLPASSAGDDSTLGRVLRDVPIDVRRSGLILLLVSTPGTASIIAEAIDRSTLSEQAGTLAGDNTVLVLFGDEERLARWQDRFLRLQEAARQ